jgi:CRISPR-associated protein Csx14
VVAPVGTSPPVVTEFIDYVERVLEEDISDLTLLSTKEELIQQSSTLINVSLKVNRPSIHVHNVTLPFEDISSQDSSQEFAKIAAEILSNQKSKFGANQVYLCVAGGRKEMCIILSVLAQLLPVDGVYHVVMPSVTMYNQELELLRKDIRELNDSNERESFYKGRREKFDRIMFPEPRLYCVIKIPIIPIAPEFLEDFCKLRQDLPVPVARFRPKLLQQLEKLRYVRISSKGIYLTEEGGHLKKVLQIFR